MFLVVLVRSGPEWRTGAPLEQQSGWSEHAALMDDLVADGFVVLGGPLADEHRVVLAVDAPSPAVVRSMLEKDPWHGTHLVIDAIEEWTVRLDGRP
jgi:hypothetical protein